MTHVSVNEFVENPVLWLDRSAAGEVHITREGRTVAVLSRPSGTPVSDSLIGLLSGTGVKDKSDIKAMRLGL